MSVQARGFGAGQRRRGSKKKKKNTFSVALALPENEFSSLSLPPFAPATARPMRAQMAFFKVKTRFDFGSLAVSEAWEGRGAFWSEEQG